MQMICQIRFVAKLGAFEMKCCLKGGRKFLDLVIKGNKYLLSY